MAARILSAIVLLAVVLAEASTATACSTCRIGRGTPDTFSGGMIVQGGVGADPMHAGTSFAVDDLERNAIEPVNAPASEMSRVFNLQSRPGMIIPFNGP